MVTDGPGGQDAVAKIEQRAVRLSALLREIDNHPVELEPGTREHLDEALKMVEVRIQATRTLLRQGGNVPSAL